MGGSGGIAAGVQVQLGTKWRRVVSLTSRPLYPRGRRPQYPLNGLREHQSRYGCFGAEENPWPLPAIDPRIFDCPACSLVTAVTNTSLRASVQTLVLSVTSKTLSLRYVHLIRIVYYFQPVLTFKK
jgi:hypothetical protein